MYFATPAVKPGTGLPPLPISLISLDVRIVTMPTAVSITVSNCCSAKHHCLLRSTAVTSELIMARKIYKPPLGIRVILNMKT